MAMNLSDSTPFSDSSNSFPSRSMSTPPASNDGLLSLHSSSESGKSQISERFPMFLGIEDDLKLRNLNRNTHNPPIPSSSSLQGPFSEATEFSWDTPSFEFSSNQQNQQNHHSPTFMSWSKPHLAHRFEFSVIGILLGLGLSIFTIIPVTLLVQSSFLDLPLDIRSHFPKYKSPSYSNTGEQCQKPFDIIFLEHHNIHQFQVYLILLLVAGVIIPKGTHFTSFQLIFNTISRKKHKEIVFQVLLFLFLGVLLRSLEFFLFTSLPYFYTLFMLQLLIIVSLSWYFISVEKYSFISGVAKMGIAAFTLQSFAYAAYRIFIVPLYFNSDSDLYKILIRLILHPILSEVQLLCIRFLSEFLSTNASFHTSHTYLLFIPQQFILQFFGRILSLSLSSGTAIFFTNFVILIQDTIFRSTSWYRDFYLFSKHITIRSNSNIDDDVTSELLGTYDQTFETSAQLHYHLYYLDEISSQCSIICATTVIYISDLRNYDGSHRNTTTLITQAVIALTLDFFIDLFRSFLTLYYSKTKLNRILSTSISPNSFVPTVLSPRKPKWKLFAMWYANIDFWVHSLWENHRLPNFLSWMFFLYIGATISLLYQFTWFITCVYPDGSVDFI